MKIALLSILSACLISLVGCTASYQQRNATDALGNYFPNEKSRRADIIGGYLLKKFGDTRKLTFSIDGEDTWRYSGEVFDFISRTAHLGGHFSDGVGNYVIRVSVDRSPGSSKKGEIHFSIFDIRNLGGSPILRSRSWTHCTSRTDWCDKINRITLSKQIYGLVEMIEQGAV